MTDMTEGDVANTHSDNDDDTHAQLLIRAWAECRTDLEMELGLPADQRAARIEALIAERNAELAKQPVVPKIAQSEAESTVVG